LSEQEQGEQILALEIEPVRDPVRDPGVPSDNVQAGVLTEIHNELNNFSCNLTHTENVNEAQETEDRRDGDYVIHDLQDDPDIQEESRKEENEDTWGLPIKKGIKKKKGKK